jgi:Lipoate synthase
MLQDIEIKALKGESKTARLRIKPDATRVPLRKPSWIRIKHPAGYKVDKLKKTLAFNKNYYRCEEAQCPN